MIESTQYDLIEDFETNYGGYINENGITAEQISRKKGIPVIIAQVKLGNALKRGRIVKDDRI